MPEYLSESLRQRVRETFANRCAYCLSSQIYVYGKLEIEHIHPKSRGGTNDESNLCLSCRFCNSHKSDIIEAVDPLTDLVVPIFNPRTQLWNEHFQWHRDGARIIGKTPTGRATVIALQLNNEIALAVRYEWVRVDWYPPHDLI